MRNLVTTKKANTIRKTRLNRERRRGRKNTERRKRAREKRNRGTTGHSPGFAASLLASMLLASPMAGR
jgi:hypothetical protein